MVQKHHLKADTTGFTHKNDTDHHRGLQSAHHHRRLLPHAADLPRSRLQQRARQRRPQGESYRRTKQN